MKPAVTSLLWLPLLSLPLAACGSQGPARPPSVARSKVSDAQQTRLGEPAPAFPTLRWLGDTAPPVMQGKVVLLRFFTSTCPFCKATAPALAELDQRYSDDDVLIVGVFHPKPRGSAYSEGDVESFAQTYGWTFPVALDDDWVAMDRFWPEELRYTSFSVLIDRRGRLRYLHPGPEFHPSDDPKHAQCDADFHDIDNSIAALVAETPAAD